MSIVSYVGHFSTGIFTRLASCVKFLREGVNRPGLQVLVCFWHKFSFNANLPEMFAKNIFFSRNRENSVGIYCHCMKYFVFFLEFILNFFIEANFLLHPLEINVSSSYRKFTPPLLSNIISKIK